MSTPARVPGGVPDGGQFASQTKAESDVSLSVIDGQQPDVDFDAVLYPLQYIEDTVSGGTPKEYWSEEMHAYSTAIDTALTEFEASGQADTSRLAERLRSIGSDEAAQASKSHSPFSGDYIREELNRVADAVEGSRAEFVTCPDCFGSGERSTGEREWDTGAHITHTCGSCQGQGELSAAAYDSYIEDQRARDAELDAALGVDPATTEETKAAAAALWGDPWLTATDESEPPF